MRTVTIDDTGPGVPITVLPDCRFAQAASTRRHERLPTVLVLHVEPPIADVVVEDHTHLAGQSQESLATLAVLDRRARVGAMNDREELLLPVVVFEVQCMKAAQPEHRMPQQCQRDVLLRGVLVLVEVREHRLGIFTIERHVAGILLGRDVRRADLVVEIGVDAVDRPQPADEDAQRIHLASSR